MFHIFTSFCQADSSFSHKRVLSVLQKVSEKVGGAEGTKLDDDFTEMEKVSLKSLHYHLGKKTHALSCY